MSRERHEVQHVTIHGHHRAFVKVGSGPALLLLHGLGCDHTTWDPVIDSLARRYTVIAPDLLGHGSPPSRAPTTASAATPTGCATCSPCSASTR